MVEESTFFVDKTVTTTDMETLEEAAVFKHQAAEVITEGVETTVFDKYTDKISLALDSQSKDDDSTEVEQVTEVVETFVTTITQIKPDQQTIEEQKSLLAVLGDAEEQFEEITEVVRTTVTAITDSRADAKTAEAKISSSNIVLETAVSDQIVEEITSEVDKTVTTTVVQSISDEETAAVKQQTFESITEVVETTVTSTSEAILDEHTDVEHKASTAIDSRFKDVDSTKIEEVTEIVETTVTTCTHTRPDEEIIEEKQPSLDVVEDVEEQFEEITEVIQTTVKTMTDSRAYAKTFSSAYELETTTSEQVVEETTSEVDKMVTTTELQFISDDAVTVVKHQADELVTEVVETTVLDQHTDKEQKISLAVDSQSKDDDSTGTEQVTEIVETTVTTIIQIKPDQQTIEEQKSLLAVLGDAQEQFEEITEVVQTTVTAITDSRADAKTNEAKISSSNIVLETAVSEQIVEEITSEVDKTVATTEVKSILDEERAFVKQQTIESITGVVETTVTTTPETILDEHTGVEQKASPAVDSRSKDDDLTEIEEVIEIVETTLTTLTQTDEQTVEKQKSLLDVVGDTQEQFEEITEVVHTTVTATTDSRDVAKSTEGKTSYSASGLGTVVSEKTMKTASEMDKTMTTIEVKSISDEATAFVEQQAVESTTEVVEMTVTTMSETMLDEQAAVDLQSHKDNSENEEHFTEIVETTAKTMTLPIESKTDRTTTLENLAMASFALNLHSYRVRESIAFTMLRDATAESVAQESEHAFDTDKRHDSDVERIDKPELSAPSERSDIPEDLRREESRLADTRKSSLSAVEGSVYDDDSPLLTDFTTSSITYVSERVDSSSLELMAGDSFGDFLKVKPAAEKKIDVLSPSSCISYATTISETIDSYTHDTDRLLYTGGSIQQDVPTEYERSVSLSDNAASDFSTESATKYNLPYDTESDSHDVMMGLPKPRDDSQETRQVKSCKLMSIDPRHESASPQSDVTEYTESVSYVESIIDSTNYDSALKQKENLKLEQQKQEEKKDAQEKLALVKGQTIHEVKEKEILLKKQVSEKKDTTQVKKKSKPKATVTKISLQKQTPIEISKQSTKTVDIKSGSKSVEYTSSTSRSTTVSRTHVSTRSHGYMQSTLSRDQKVLKPLNLTDSTHSSPVKSSHRSTSSTTVVQPPPERRAKSSRDTSGSRSDMTASKSLNKPEPISSSAVKKQEPLPVVQSTKHTRASTDRSERTGRSSSSSISSSISRYHRSRKSTTEPIDKHEPVKKSDKEQANLVTKTTASTSKSSKERTNKSLIPVKVPSAKGSPKKEPPVKASAGKKPTKTVVEDKPQKTVIVMTTKSYDVSTASTNIITEATQTPAKIGFVRTAPRMTKTVHTSGDSKRDDTYRCKSAMHYSYKDAVAFDHAEIPSSLPSSPSRLNKSSSNSTNVLTSEVFTRTIDSSKSIEVIYRQPSTSNELIRKINEYRYNDIDLTTDSSLSDSIALPSSSSDHEGDVLGKRKRSGSPASPKPYATTSSASSSAATATTRKQVATSSTTTTSQQIVSDQRYRKSDIWMRAGPQPPEVPMPFDGDDEIYQALHAIDRRTVASLDGIVMESRISPILDFRASTPPRLKYKFDYDSSLFTDDKQEEDTQASASFEETDTQPQTEITIPKPTPRSQSNLTADVDASAATTSVATTTSTTTTTSSAAAVASSLTTSSALATKPTDEASFVETTDHDKPGVSGDASEFSSSQEPLPVPRPRTSISSRTDTQTRSSIIESFDQPEDSIEQYPEPSSLRQESVASEDFSGAAQKDSVEFETSEEDLSATKFYIGERSSDVITRTTSEKRSDYAFDNIGYEYSQDSGADEEPQQDPFKAYREKVTQEDSFTLKQLQEVETGTALDEEIKAEVIEIIEGIADQSKTFELDLERRIDAPHQPVVHSPIQPQVAKLVESAKPSTQKPTVFEEPSQPEVIKRTIDELAIEKTLEEVKESLDAVHEELIESVVDGKLIKQSPSEFEFKVLPSTKYSQDPIYEAQQEEVIVSSATTTTADLVEPVTITTIISEPIILTEIKNDSFEQKTSDPESKETSYESARPDGLTPISSDSSFAKLDVSPRMRKSPHHPKGTRWSATDIDSSGESQYQSFEQTDSSRPQSSDVDNLMQQYVSSEYETALDNSIIPPSTEYHSAASTLNSFNVSTNDSLKSFDSESSGNLASIESEATETLVPSTMDIDFDSSDAAALIHDDSEDDLREKLLLDDKEDLSSISGTMPVAMKRSQEMHFTVDLMDDQRSEDSQEVFQLQEDVEEQLAQEQSEKLSSSIGNALDLMESMKASSLEDVKTECIDDIKLGTSLEDGSILSISLSSASNLETIMENLTDKATDSFPTHMEIGLDAITPIAGTSAEMIGDITLTSSVGREGDVNFLNTQATTEMAGAKEATDENSKKRGHKRSESTISGQLMSEIAAEARDSLDSQEESVSLEASKQSSVERDGTREESSDSDYDRYESEYSRSFRAPLIQSQKKKKDKVNEGYEIEVEHDRRNSFSPSSSVIETIVEDVHAEIEQGDEAQQLMEIKKEQLQEYQQTSATIIPDIQVTEDVQMEDSEEEPMGASYSAKPMERETSDHKIQYAVQEEFKISEEQYQEMIDQKYKSKMADITNKFDFEADDKDDSAGSDSFEMLEQPDISDEFVIVEEVAREAHECDMEGKSVSIQQVKMEKKHDEEVEKMLVKSAPAHTNAGSLYANMREDMMYAFEDSPPTGSEEVDPNAVTMDLLNNGYPLEESKRWVEMQLAETQNYRYPYDERLEDIKEEDEVGSSRIGSIKDSFSSTPDYDMLAKRLASRGGEHDDISMSSLQEFESLEQVISLENRKMQQGSQDSLSNGSFTKRFLARGGHGDDISLSSLKEFEGLETACLEAQLIEIKAKEEAALLLSRSDESNKSDRSNGVKRSPPTNGTVVRATTSSTTVTSGPEQQTTKVETSFVTKGMSKDSLSTTTTATTVTTVSHESQVRHALEEEDTSHLLTVSSDSLDGNRIQQQTISKDTLPSAHSSSDSLEINNKNNMDLMTSSIDSIEFSRAGAMTTRSSRSDSIEQIALQQPPRSDSTDSIEMQHAVMSRASETKRDSLESLPYSIENKSTSSSPTKSAAGQRMTTESVMIAGSSSVSYHQTGMTKDISIDSLTGQDAFLTSTESLETSSTATNATYQNETDSQMSSSVTSCGSITMVDTLDNFGDLEGFGLQESMTFQSSSSTTMVTASTSSSGQQQQQQQLLQHQQQQQQQQQQHTTTQVLRSSTSSTTTTTSATASTRSEFPLAEIELLSRQMYPGDLTFDDAKETAKEKLQSKTTEKED
ncbi:serine-rich adhesin for platelets-like isoform X2 [Ochlerotatus camptorhynchus]|uniref:serine-rich adhesin for platelets-like isoform X2 n=1 Tax=Ochlerotatus camptorhynchus TaxID=644619 RepID=UPI0031DD7105